MTRFLIVALAYLGTALTVTTLWTLRAKTETHSNRFASIVAIADGTGPQPFVKRRLLCDAARGVAALVPATAWRGLSDAIDTHPRLARLIRDTLGWRRVDDGLLISATVLIALSVLGFQVAIRVWLDRLYVMPPGAARLGAVALGLALLGGGGDLRFGFYPYDLPHTFVFALGLLAIHARSLWLLPVFALATYSKETAILLIPAYLLVADRWSSRHTLGMTVALLAIFVVIRLVLDRQYGRGIGGFWFPGRNARWLAWYLAFDAWWYWPVVIVAILRLGRQAALYPRELRRLSVLVVPLLGLAFFKGWIEEKRQYLEMLPILGPLSLQWVAIELGWGESFVARTRGVPPISDHLPGQPCERPLDGTTA